MNWLKRLEDLYLNILRVVIIISATLLLIGAVLGAVYAVPKLLPKGAAADARDLVTSDTLGDYQREKRGEPQPGLSQSLSDEQAADSGKIDDRTRRAAASITRYLRENVDSGVVQATVEQFLVAKQTALPANLQGPYAESLLKLADDLNRTKPAGIDLDSLIDWHYTRFTSAEEAAAQAEVERAADNQSRMMQAAAMGGAALAMFMLFLLLVFSFVLVKIERNLRLLPVRMFETTPST